MKEAVQKIFVGRVKELMAKQNLTQKKLSSLCGITEVAFSRYITEERTPRSDTLANIANALHTSCDYLLGNDNACGFDQLSILLANSKDDLTLNQKKQLTEILMKEYKRQEV